MPSNPTIDAYNQYAALYDREVIEFWENFPHDFLSQFAQHAPGKRILNVGSGSGRDAMLLRDMGLEIICQDGSQSEGETARMIERKSMPGARRYFKNYSSQELREPIEPLGFTLLYENRYQPHNNVYLNQLYKITG